MAKFTTPTLETTIDAHMAEGTKALDDAQGCRHLPDEAGFVLAPMIYSDFSPIRAATQNIAGPGKKESPIATIAVVRLASIHIIDDSISVSMATDGYIVPKYPSYSTSGSIREFSRQLPGHVSSLSDHLGVPITMVGLEFIGIPVTSIIGANTNSQMFNATLSAGSDSLDAIAQAGSDPDSRDTMIKALTELPSLISVVGAVAARS